jgi:hypothetical protein
MPRFIVLQKFERLAIESRQSYYESTIGLVLNKTGFTLRWVHEHACNATWAICNASAMHRPRHTVDPSNGSQWDAVEASLGRCNMQRPQQSTVSQNGDTLDRSAQETTFSLENDAVTRPCSFGHFEWTPPAWTAASFGAGARASHGVVLAFAASLVLYVVRSICMRRQCKKLSTEHKKYL